ncbi:MAG: hypothetical protein NVS2B5_28370 [Beijerinckiaceae bacterium]
MAQMPLAKHDDVVKAFASDRTDQPFSMSILPWRLRRRWPITNAHRANAPGIDFAVGSIAIADGYFGADSQPNASVS